MSSADSNRGDLPLVGTPAPSVDSLADPVVVVDLDGVLRYANDTAAEVLGWDVVELLGGSVLELVHPDDLNLAIAALDTVVTKSVGDLIALRLRTGQERGATSSCAARSAPTTPTTRTPE